MIPVPTGSRHSLTLSGSCEKHVSCEFCRCEFMYVAKRRGTGEFYNPFDVFTDRHVQKRLERRAEEALDKAFQSPDMVACPSCGHYQADMIRWLNRWRLKVALKIGVPIAPLTYLLN